MAFISSAKLHENNLWWPYRVIVVILSLFLAWILHHLVESKFRIKNDTSTYSLKPLLITSVALIILILVITSSSDNTKNYAHESRVNIGLSDECGELNFHTNNNCRNSVTPKTLIWGDSFAMHLVPGLIKTADQGLIQATKSTCAPTTNIALFNPPKFNTAWAEKCLKFNIETYTYLSKEKSIDTVILSSQWSYLLTNPTEEIRHVKLHEENILPMRIKNIDIADDLIELATNIQSLGKNVIIISPPPTANFNIAKCHERNETRKWSFGDNQNCAIDYLEYVNKSRHLTELMSKLEKAKIPIYSFTEKLCDEKVCKTKLNDIILYRDSGHLSISGSQHYAEHFNLFDEIKTLLVK